MKAAGSWGLLWIVFALWLEAGRASAVPAIAPISDQTISEDGSTGAIQFLISGFESRTPSVTGSSGNSQLVSASGIAITGSGRSWAVTVTPLPNQTGTATITIRLEDPAGTDTEDFLLTVTAVNDPPTITNISDQTTNEDQTLGPISFTMNDVDTPLASLTVTTTTSNGNVVPASGISVTGSGNDRTLTVTPAANQSGNSTIGVFVNDGSFNTATRFTLTVTPVNDPPTISDVPDQTISENGQVGPISFGVGDVDNGASSLTVTGSSSNPTLIPDANIAIGSAAATGAGRTVTVTPARNQSGVATITLTVSDAGGATSSDTFTVTVNAINRAPTISDLTDQSTPEDTSLGPISFTINDTETNPDSLTITRTSGNQTLVPDANISIGGSGGSRTITITPAANAFGSALITVAVSDGNLSASDEFTLTVTSVNDPPTISDITDQSISENGQAGPLSFLATDLETGIADLVVTGGSSNPNLIPNGNIVIASAPGAGRTVTVTPLPNQSGSALITLTVSDGSATATDTFNVTVSAVNRVPTISNVPDQVTLEDTTFGPISFTISDAETSADGLTITRTSGNQTLVPDANITIGGSGGSRTVTITPVANAFGSALITLTVSDGSLSASDQFTLTVTSVNDPPTISDIPDQAINANATLGPINFVIGDIESGPDRLQVTASSSNTALVPAANISLSGSGANQAVTVTPVATQSGSTTITVTVSDGAVSASDAFVVTVTAVIEAPRIISGPQNATVNEGETATFTVSATGTAPLLYQWLFNGQEILGNNFANYVVRNAQASHTGTYSVRVSNSAGTVTSPTVTLTVQQFDYGDAPESTLAVLYHTKIAAKGPRHRIAAGFFLGRSVDAEPDGQPTADALGDDNNPASNDDEDGVQFTSTLSPGKAATLMVTASAQGVLDAWFDFNRTSGFEATEHAINKVALVPGQNTLSLNVPAGAVAGDTFARFRLSRAGLETPDDLGSTVPDGEVEDYKITIATETVQLDFGDAPDVAAGITGGVGYPTLLGRNGARHVLVSGFFLGQRVDAEANGQPNATATGDDLNPERLDDEDGVQLPNALVPGQSAQITVTASQAGKLDAWIDFNRNTSWADQGEQIFVSVTLVSGINTLSFPVPTSAQHGASFARFRFSRDGKLGFVGQASEGEVEDYQVAIESSDPCDVNYKGSDFWLTFPGNYPASETAPLTLTLCIVGAQGTTGTVDVLRSSSDFTIPASMSVLVTLPDAASLGDVIDVVQTKGIHVTASAPVAVYGLNRIPYSSDGFLGLPTGALGQEYIVLGYPNVFNGVSALNGTQFALVAPEDETLVTIIPSRNVLGHPQGEPFIVELNKGQTYQLRDPEDATADLSGTEIIANKRIAVFGSHQCANINSPSRLFCDYLVEQLLPTTAWGKLFYSVPLLTRLGGDIFRIIARYDNTTVYVNGVENATLDRGEIRTLNLSGAARINSDKPVYMTQLAKSSDADGVENADPFMVVVPPTRAYTKDHMVCTGPGAFPDHYISIVAPASVVGALTLDGVAVAAASFSPIGGSGFSFARLQLAQGTHSLSAAQPFATIVYGFGPYESYSWPGGMFFGDITAPVITCPDNFILPLGGFSPNTGATSCRAAVPDLRGQAKVSDNCLLPPERVVSQTPPPGTLVEVGTHEITLTARDAADNEASCVVLMTVIDPAPPVILCPKDMFVPCTKGTGANVVFQATAQSPCGTSAEVECTPPSGSFFPAGVTTVTCKVKDFPAQTCTFKVTVQCDLTANGTILGPQALSLTWTDGAELEAADHINGPWIPVPGVASPFRPAPTGTQQFFRVRQLRSATTSKASQTRPVLSIQPSQ